MTPTRATSDSLLRRSGRCDSDSASVQSAGALFAPPSDPVAIAGHDPVQPTPQRQAARDVQRQGQRPEQRQPPGEIPDRLGPCAGATRGGDDVHIAAEIVGGKFRKLRPHLRVMKRAEPEPAGEVEPTQDRDLPAAKPALPVLEHRVAIRPGGNRTT